MITFAITKKSSLNYSAALMGLPERPLQNSSWISECFVKVFSSTFLTREIGLNNVDIIILLIFLGPTKARRSISCMPLLFLRFTFFFHYFAFWL